MIDLNLGTEVSISAGIEAIRNREKFTRRQQEDERARAAVPDYLRAHSQDLNTPVRRVANRPRSVRISSAIGPQLVSGEYQINSASEGISTLAWRLQVGSDSHCGAWLRNADAPNIGNPESPRDYETVSNTGTFFILPNGTSKWISASEIGVAIGVCSQIQ